MTFLDITIRALCSYFVLLILTRVMGKKQLSQLTFFNYVAGITIGSITANLAVNSSLPIFQGIYSLVLWALLTVLFELCSLKSRAFRTIVNGQPTILIKKGRLMKKQLVRTRTNMDEISMLLRKSNTFDIKEVDYALLDTNGRLSVLKKAEYKNYKVKDAKTPFTENKNMTAQIIIDGQVIDNNLKELNLNNEWLDQEIRKQGYLNVKEIYYAEIGSSGQLFIMPAI